MPFNEKLEKDNTTIVKPPETKQTILPPQTGAGQEHVIDQSKRGPGKINDVAVEKLSENNINNKNKQTREKTLEKRGKVSGEVVAKKKSVVNNGNNTSTRNKSLLQKEAVTVPIVQETAISTQKPAEKPAVNEQDVLQPKNPDVKADSIAIISAVQDNKDETYSNKADSSIAASARKDEKEKQPAKNKFSSSIRWGLDLSVGVSKTRENIFSFSSTNKSADALYNSPGNVSGSPTANSAQPPSSMTPGLAFKVGVIAEKKISNRSSIAAGLSYVYYSTGIKAGTVMDSSFVFRNMAAQSVVLNSYYPGTQQKDYNNSYHFIQVPLHYQLQLNKGIKLPLMWDIGVSAGYLVSTNALVYDTAAGGIYYRSKDAFNKLHFNLNTSLAVRFGKANKLQWSLGPELSMDMTPMMKTNFEQKQYFLYGGLTGRLYFRKKN